MPILQLADGGTMHYNSTAGGKPPLLFQHGWAMGESSNWVAQQAYFESRYQIITVDFRGHGQSSKDRGLTMGTFAQDIHQLIDHLQLKHVNIVGHSMGAIVLMDYIQRYGTGNLHKICFVDQSPRLMTDANWQLGIYGNFPEQTHERFLKGLKLNFQSSMLSFARNGLQDDLEKLAKEYDGPPIFPPHIIPEVMIDIYQSLIRSDYRAVIETINIPVLLTYGRHSQFYPNSVPLYMQQHIPQAKLVMFEQSQHCPPFDEPDKFNRVLDEFLSA